VLCHASKRDAAALKQQLASWMQRHLGLTLNADKTHITHWREQLRFLGYNLQGRANPNGTRWLYLSVPHDAMRTISAKIQQATRYPQAPEYDVFQNINALARGWSNYYRYAHNSSRIGGKLSSIIFWRTAHYLSTRHRCSIATTMRQHYARSPRTGWRGLYITKPGQPSTDEHRYFIWHRPPSRLGIGSPSVAVVSDQSAYLNTNWAKGRSEQQKKLTQTRAHNQCESCGRSDERLVVHHPNRLEKAKRVKAGMGHVAASGAAQTTKLLCHECHMRHHHHAQE
jgi:Group II intron, maturase-specific domain